MVIVTSLEPSKVVDPLASPDNAIVLAVVNWYACNSCSVVLTFIFEIGVIGIFVISPAFKLFQSIKNIDKKC